MNNKILIKNLILLLFFLLLVFFVRCSSSFDYPQEDRQEKFNRLLATYDLQFQELLAAAQQAMGKKILTYSSLSSETTIPIPKYMEISGSHYDYGRLVGRIAQQYGHQPRRVASDRVEFNSRIIQMYQDIYPQFLEIARGLVDVFAFTSVAELDFAHLEYNFFINLWFSLFKYDEFQKYADTDTSVNSSTSTHCSIISAKVEDDIFVGRNFDNNHLKPYFVVKTQMKGGYKVLANACYIPYHWIMDGVNEKGLFMGTANLVNPPEYYWKDPYPEVPAICEHHLFRIALETCATVDDVFALYRSIRPWSPNGTDHLLVADALGNSAVIEFNLDREAVFFPADKNYQVMTNTAYQEGMDYMMENCWRFYQATTRAEEGIVSFADLESITRSIRGSNYGYTSFFDLKKRFMRLYRKNYYQTAYDFTLPSFF